MTSAILIARALSPPYASSSNAEFGGQLHKKERLSMKHRAGLLAILLTTATAPAFGDPVDCEQTIGVVEVQRIVQESAVGKESLAPLQRAGPGERDEVQRRELGELEKRIMPVINDVAREQGYSLVFNKFNSGLLFAEDRTVDLTDAVIARFDAPLSRPIRTGTSSPKQAARGAPAPLRSILPTFPDISFRSRPTSAMVFRERKEGIDVYSLPGLVVSIAGQTASAVEFGFSDSKLGVVTIQLPASTGAAVSSALRGRWEEPDLSYPTSASWKAKRGRPFGITYVSALYTLVIFTDAP